MRTDICPHELHFCITSIGEDCAQCNLQIIVLSLLYAIRMCAFQLFFTVDPTLGRVDYTSLSDQMLVEMLIDGFDDESKKAYQDAHGAYLDVCACPGIKCDADGRVIEINMHHSNIGGSIAFCYLPPQMKYISAEVNRLTGSVDITQLPDGMETFALSMNQFTGELDLSKLPDGMKYLRIDRNQFTGELDLSKLPARIIRLNLSHNQFTGDLDLTNLPPRLKTLGINDNQLTGEVDLTNLPNRMKYLNLDNNRFCGSVVIQSGISTRIFLRGSGVTAVLNENGEKIEWEL